MKQSGRVGLVVFAGVGLLAAGAFAASRRYLPSEVVLPGLRIDGVPVPALATDAAALRSFVEARAARAGARTVQLRLAGAAPEAAPEAVVTLAELGLSVNVDEVVEAASAAGHTGDVWSRVHAAKDARAGQTDIPFRVRVDRTVAFARLQPLKARIDTEPVSAQLDLDNHTTIAGKDGRAVDLAPTVARVEEAASTAGLSTAGDFPPLNVELALAKFAPRAPSSFPPDIEISAVLSEYETFFSRAGDQKRRGKNIDNASHKLDGLLIPPGEVVSFNAVVGDRNESNGFEKSWEIFKGEMVEGVGGGTCQVASTFYAAAFFAGFEVLERLPHSRPSAYIPMGLDSTVVYPTVDLKIRNPHSFPVVVHAKTVGSKLRIELLGKVRPVDVSFARELVESIPFTRKVVEDATLTGRRVRVSQHGIKGFRIKRSRLLKYPGGTTKKEEATDFYPPTVEIYSVPTGFDVALLPALPSADPDAAAAFEAAAQKSAGVPALAPPGSPCVDSNVAPPAVEFVDAPGAHAPNAAQRDPAKTVWLKPH